jgi:hypothetical protein
MGRRTWGMKSLARVNTLKRVIRSVPWGIIPDDMERRWSVFVGNGAIVDSSRGLWVAATSGEKIDEVADLLQISWQDRW